MRRWLSLALKVSAQALHPQHRLGAVVVRGGHVLAKAANIARPLDSGHRGHAEVRALQQTDATGATLYVVRSNGRMSRPCPACWQAIRAAGVRQVIYLDANGASCIEAVH